MSDATRSNNNRSSGSNNSNSNNNKSRRPSRVGAFDLPSSKCRSDSQGTFVTSLSTEDESNEEEREKLRNSDFCSSFLLANLSGLFPVSGLRSATTTAKAEFSLRLAFTLLCLLALLVLEATSLVNLFILDRDDASLNNNLSKEGYIIRRIDNGGSLASEYAPVLHYGTTLLAVVMLLNTARHFPLICYPAWLSLERRVAPPPRSTLLTLLLSLALGVTALVQAAVGTVCATLVDFRNDTASLAELDQFFAKYVAGSHNFVSRLSEDSLVSGILTFVASNYSVLVWTVVDLTLILVCRSIADAAKSINITLEDKCKGNAEAAGDLKSCREDHFLLCRVICCLGDSGLSWVLFSFLLGNLYFLYIHFFSLLHPPIRSSFLTGYHIWAASRQLFRLLLVSYSAVGLAAEAGEKVAKLLMSIRDDMVYGKVEVRRMKEQCGKMPVGLRLGPSFSLTLDRRVLFFLLSFFTILLLFSVNQQRNDREWRMMVANLSSSNNNNNNNAFSTYSSRAKEELLQAGSSHLNVVMW